MKKEQPQELTMTHAEKLAIANRTETVFPGAYYRACRTLTVRFPAEDRTVKLWLDPLKWSPQMLAVLARSIRGNRVLAQCPMEVTLDWFAMYEGLYALSVEDEITTGIRTSVTAMLDEFDDSASAKRRAAQRRKSQRFQLKAKIKGWFTRKPKEGSDAVRSDAHPDA